MAAYGMIDDLEDLRLAIECGQVSHTRQGDGCWRNTVYVYARSAESPSGFHLAGAFADTPELQAVLQTQRGLSPLSPTEPR